MAQPVGASRAGTPSRKPAPASTATSPAGRSRRIERSGTWCRARQARGKIRLRRIMPADHSAPLTRVPGILRRHGYGKTRRSSVHCHRQHCRHRQGHCGTFRRRRRRGRGERTAPPSWAEEIAAAIREARTARDRRALRRRRGCGDGRAGGAHRRGVRRPGRAGQQRRRGGRGPQLQRGGPRPRLLGPAAPRQPALRVLPEPAGHSAPARARRRGDRQRPPRSAAWSSGRTRRPT